MINGRENHWKHIAYCTDILILYTCTWWNKLQGEITQTTQSANNFPLSLAQVEHDALDTVQLFWSIFSPSSPNHECGKGNSFGVSSLVSSNSAVLLWFFSFISDTMNVIVQWKAKKTKNNMLFDVSEAAHIQKRERERETERESKRRKTRRRSASIVQQLSMKKNKRDMLQNKDA